MRQIIPLLLLFLLLCGCAASRPEPSEPLSSIPTEETAPPTTVPTEPVDPLQMLLESMSTEEKVGQLFLARCPAENAEEDIGRYHLGGYLLFGQDFEGETALMAAAEVGDLDIVKCLLDNGANVMAENADGDTAIDIASEWGNNDCAKLLAEHRNKLKVQRKNKRLKLVGRKSVGITK